MRPQSSIPCSVSQPICAVFLKKCSTTQNVNYTDMAVRKNACLGHGIVPIATANIPK